jgi:hypothetical protein
MKRVYVARSQPLTVVHAASSCSPEQQHGLPSSRWVVQFCRPCIMQAELIRAERGALVMPHSNHTPRCTFRATLTTPPAVHASLVALEKWQHAFVQQHLRHHSALQPIESEVRSGCRCAFLQACVGSSTLPCCCATAHVLHDLVFCLAVCVQRQNVPIPCFRGTG